MTTTVPSLAVAANLMPTCGGLAKFIFLDESNFPHWVSMPFLLQTDRSARVLPRMGQATPASRCEPTFRSSETPALLRPGGKSSLTASCGMSGRRRSGSGTHA